MFGLFKAVILLTLLLSVIKAWKNVPSLRTYSSRTNVLVMAVAKGNYGIAARYSKGTYVNKDFNVYANTGARSQTSTSSYIAASAATHSSSPAAFTKGSYGIASRITKPTSSIRSASTTTSQPVATNVSGFVAGKAAKDRSFVNSSAQRKPTVQRVSKGTYENWSPHLMLSRTSPKSSIQQSAAYTTIFARTPSLTGSSVSSPGRQPETAARTGAAASAQRSVKGGYGIAARVPRPTGVSSSQGSGSRSYGGTGYAPTTSAAAATTTTTTRSPVSSSAPQETVRMVTNAVRTAANAVAKGSYGIAARIRKPGTTKPTSGFSSGSGSRSTTVTAAAATTPAYPKPRDAAAGSRTGVAKGSYGIAARVKKPTSSRLTTSSMVTSNRPSSPASSAVRSVSAADNTATAVGSSLPPSSVRSVTTVAQSTPTTSPVQGRAGVAKGSYGIAARIHKPGKMNAPPAAPSMRIQTSSADVYRAPPSSGSTSTSMSSSSFSYSSGPTPSLTDSNREVRSNIVNTVMTLAAAVGVLANYSPTTTSSSFAATMQNSQKHVTPNKLVSVETQQQQVVSERTHMKPTRAANPASWQR